MRTQPSLALMTCLMVGLLSGCSYPAHETRAAYEPVTDSTASNKPLVVLPGETNSVITVLESRVSGVYTQRTVLASDTAASGENAVTVQIDQTDKPPADLGAIPRPTTDIIAKELETNFPTVDMQISRAWGHNDFGPFGYAVGKATGGGTCFYAWQFALGPTLRLVDDPQVRSAAESMPSSPTSIRVRLCRHGLSEAELVAMVRAMQVYPLGGGAPFHDTQFAAAGGLGATDALQAAGAPAEVPGATSAPGKAHKASKAAHRHAARRRAAAEDAPQASAPVTSVVGSVVVPLPSGPATASTSGVNPLLAPLQAAPQPRAAATSDDMPLPGAAPPSLGAPASTRPTSTIPLPN